MLRASNFQSLTVMLLRLLHRLKTNLRPPRLRARRLLLRTRSHAERHQRSNQRSQRRELPKFPVPQMLSYYIDSTTIPLSNRTIQECTTIKYVSQPCPSALKWRRADTFQLCSLGFSGRTKMSQSELLSRRKPMKSDASTMRSTPNTNTNHASLPRRRSVQAKPRPQRSLLLHHQLKYYNHSQTQVRPPRLQTSTLSQRLSPLAHNHHCRRSISLKMVGTWSTTSPNTTQHFSTTW